ncbi:MAG: Cysteine desulfurase [Labilithrix sp.]|nr:Cysteine desulfurase [Labilithrix sp.]
MSVPGEADLLATRPDFPTLTKGVHLISHSLGAMPKQARAYVNQFMDEWENESINAWHEWLPAVKSLGDVVGTVLGVDPGTVAILPNVSTVQSFVASCFTFGSEASATGRFAGRNKIVYDDTNFSTVHYVWQEQARRGADVHVVKSRDGIHPPIDELCAAIDEKTLLVPISHVLFRSSGMYDAKRVIDRAHEVGAMVLLDCYQSAGTVPLALKDWGCDMACGGSVKWACGGPGAAYLYVRPDLLEHLKPTSTGWFAHAEPFAFDMGPMRYAADVWRMIGGTMAVPAVYTARAGWETVARLGVERIRAKSLRQTALLRELVLSRGFTVNTPRGDAERGGTICFDFAGADLVSRTLASQKFFHDYRPRCGIRVSPHFYTTDEELERFMKALDEVRAKGPDVGAKSAY